MNINLRKTLGSSGDIADLVTDQLSTEVIVLAVHALIPIRVRDTCKELRAIVKELVAEREINE